MRTAKDPFFLRISLHLFFISGERMYMAIITKYLFLGQVCHPQHIIYDSKQTKIFLNKWWSNIRLNGQGALSMIACHFRKWKSSFSEYGHRQIQFFPMDLDDFNYMDVHFFVFVLFFRYSWQNCNKTVRYLMCTTW